MPEPRQIEVFKLVTTVSDGVVEVAPSTAALLASMGPRPVAVIAVMGSLRTGKSTLQSIIAQHVAAGGLTTPSVAEVQSGTEGGVFEASDSGRPVTAGIDAAVIRREGGLPDLVLLDVEGSGDRSTKHDMRLAVVAAMLSSSLVLNTKGAPGREDLLGRLGFLSKAAKAVAAGAKRSGRPSSGTRLGESLVVLARDYELSHTASDVARTIFGLEDDDLTGDDDEADDVMRRNRVRAQLASAFGNCSAMLLPDPRGTLRCGGATFDEAMRDDVIPTLLANTGHATSAPGGRGALTASALGDAAQALCQAVSSDSFRELVPSSVADAMVELAAARGAARMSHYVTTAAALIKAWVQDRHGVPVGAVIEVMGRVGAELDAIVAEASEQAPERAAELAAHGADVLGAARQELLEHAAELAAGRFGQATRLRDEALSAWVLRTHSLAAELRTAMRRVGASETAEALAAVELEAVESGVTTAARGMEAVLADVRRELATLDAAHQVGTVDDVTEGAVHALTKALEADTGLLESAQSCRDSPGAVPTEPVRGAGTGASLPRQIAVQLLHCEGGIPEEWTALRGELECVDAAVAEVNGRALTAFRRAKSDRSAVLVEEARRREQAAEEARRRKRQARKAAQQRLKAQADERHRQEVQEARERQAEAEAARRRERQARKAAERSREAAEARRRQAEAEAEQLRREAEHTLRRRAEAALRARMEAPASGAGGGGMPAARGAARSERLPSGMDWNSFRTFYKAMHGRTDRDKQSAAYQAYKRGQL